MLEPRTPTNRTSWSASPRTPIFLGVWVNVRPLTPWTPVPSAAPGRGPPAGEEYSRLRRHPCPFDSGHTPRNRSSPRRERRRRPQQCPRLRGCSRCCSPRRPRTRNSGRIRSGLRAHLHGWADRFAGSRRREPVSRHRVERDRWHPVGRWHRSAFGNRARAGTASIQTGWTAVPLAASIIVTAGTTYAIEIGSCILTAGNLDWADRGSYSGGGPSSPRTGAPGDRGTLRRLRLQDLRRAGHDYDHHLGQASVATPGRLDHGPRQTAVTAASRCTCSSRWGSLT